MAYRNFYKKYFITFFLALIPILILSCDDTGKDSSTPANHYTEVDYTGEAIEYLTWDIWELKENSEYYMGPEGNNDPEEEPLYEDENWVLAEQFTGYGPDIRLREVMVFKEGTIKYFYQFGEPDFMYCGDYDGNFTADEYDYYISGDPIHYIVNNGDLIEYDFIYNDDESRWEMSLNIYKQLETFATRARLDCF